MKSNRPLKVLASLAAVFLSFTSIELRSESEPFGWAWMKWYPWVWVVDEQPGWIYFSQSSPQYYSVANEAWQSIGEETVIGPNFEEPYKALLLEMGEAASPVILTIEYNLSGVPWGYLSFGDQERRSVDYAYHYDEEKDSCLFFVTLREPEADSRLAFALSLSFTSETSGSYQLIGDLEKSSCLPCHESGVFTIGDLSTGE